MPSRMMFMVFLLAGAFLPYIVSNQSSIRDAVTGPFKSEGAPKPAASGTAQSAAPANLVAGAAQFQPNSSQAAPAGAPAKSAVPATMVSQSRSTPAEPFIPFEQALRWQVTPAWILGNWPRVTTHLAELQLQGYRVTLVSGTQQADIAGSITYYFDPRQELKKIVFHGTTGDARRLVQFVTSNHRFERRLTDDPSVYLYQVEYDGQALSELKIKTASIVRSASAYSRFEIALTMNRPEE
ncbi:MAG: hypothetical protein QM775_30560 [Pirellulales bacterium]